MALYYVYYFLEKTKIDFSRTYHVVNKNLLQANLKQKSDIFEKRTNGFNFYLVKREYSPGQLYSGQFFPLFFPAIFSE